MNGRTRPLRGERERKAARCRVVSRVAVSAGFLATFFAHADGAPATPATVRTVDPETRSGRVVLLSLHDGLELHTDGAVRRTPPEDLVRITFAPVDRTRGRRDLVLRLGNGDVLYGRVKRADRGTVLLETTSLGEVELALETIAQIDMPPAFETAYEQSVRWLDRDRTARDDRVLLTNGDVLRGFVTELNEEAVLIDGPLGEVAAPLRLVVAVRFADVVTSDDLPLRAMLIFRDGARVTVCALDYGPERVSATLCLGPSVRVAVDRIAQIEFLGGRWEWLSDHTPISAEHTPMLSLGWEPQMNRNVHGGALRVAGDHFRYGIGVHSRSSLMYDLGGKYARFETLFGMDDDSGPLADVDVLIRVDGQPRFRLNHVQAGKLHGPVRLELRGANRLELLVEFGANGDVQDRFDWIEPALIR